MMKNNQANKENEKRMKKVTSIERKCNYRNKGITLIALVITIIVLLILAGVTISTLTGENGIITQASNATEKTNIENAREKIMLEVLDSYDTTGNINMDTLKENLENNLGIDVSNVGASLPTGTIILDGYDFYIDEDAEVIYGEAPLIFAKEINATNYGDYVEYPIDLNQDGDLTNDWKIFYDNDEYVFLISEDYISNTSTFLNLSDAKILTSDTHNFYWDTSELVNLQEVTNDILMLFKATGYTLNDNYENSRITSTLLNTDNWTGLVNSTYADFAIGGPTIEMWMASWNEKGYTNLYCNNTNDYGYYIGITSIPTTTIQYLTSTDIEKSGYNDKLYFPHTVSYNSSGGYWLVGPAATNASGLYAVTWRGRIDFFGNGYHYRTTTCCLSKI